MSRTFVCILFLTLFLFFSDNQRAESDQLYSWKGFPGQGLELTATISSEIGENGFKIVIYAVTASYHPNAKFNPVYEDDKFDIEILVTARKKCNGCKPFYKNRYRTNMEFENGETTRLDAPISIYIPWHVYNDADQFNISLLGKGVLFLFTDSLEK